MQAAILLLLIFCALMLIYQFLHSSQPSEPPELDTQPLEESLSRLRQELNASTTQAMNGLAKVLSQNQNQFTQMQQSSMNQFSRSMNGRLIAFEERLKALESTNQQKLEELNTTSSQNIGSMSKMLSDNQTLFSQTQQNSMEQLTRSLTERLQSFEERLKSLETTNQQKLEYMNQTMNRNLLQIQNDNAKKLESIQNTVDEKLQKTLEEKMTRSFETVSKRLEEVYRGLGEMQNLASGVGDLKKVLSNVKTRGILGEIQLGAILREILAPEQYETEIPTVPNSRDHVEFAVRIPTAEDGGMIYLPIDSKFPGDTYAALQDAYNAGEAEQIQAARKQLTAVLKRSAKDIHDKYIAPPYTTNFGILFLPFEGLYAEVVNMGLVEELQRIYHVNIAGPSTMAAMLSALQMSFQTIQIQKRSSEVWEVLGAVKNEFGKFHEVLDSARKRIHQLDDDLDKLIGVRTRSIAKKLRSVEQLDDNATQKLLGDWSEES